MRIVDIWTLDIFSRSKQNIEEEQERLGKLASMRAIKYAVRILWPELAKELDEMSLNEVKVRRLFEE